VRNRMVRAYLWIVLCFLSVLGNANSVVGWPPRQETVRKNTANVDSSESSSAERQVALKSLDEVVKRASTMSAATSDTHFAETLGTLSLLSDLEPKGRHRFVLPRSSSASKLNADHLKKALDVESSGLKLAIEALGKSVEKEIESADSEQNWELGYRLRWRLAGLNAILPSTSDAKRARNEPWSHAKFLDTAPNGRKAFANHPKTRWPANSYTVMTTPHFEIASQSDTRSTVEVANLSEQAFAVWKQFFYSAWANKQTVAPEYVEQIDHKFSVVLFRDRESYTKALRSVANISNSTGYYDPNEKVVFFYWDQEKTPSTLVHELTHQFFYEASANPVELDANRGKGFWVIEGVALYMESLSTRGCGGSLIVELGGWDAPRLQAGRYRRLHDKYWVPWEEFHWADGKRFRAEEDIRAWYSQATGLAHLWLDGSIDKRVAFAAYVASVYANQESTELLGDWDDDKTMRDAYDRYLISGPSAMARRHFFANRREAVLCRTKLSAKELLDWPVEFRTTPWLDLSFSQIDDLLFTDVEKLPPHWNVQRLNLESTKVTDTSLPAIAGMKNLADLDLSNCDVSDEGIKALSGHKALKTLWLNECKVTDESMAVLSTIPQLESVHLSKTKVTQNGWRQLLAAKPRLKSKSTAP
jgi:Leucine Rich repeat